MKFARLLLVGLAFVLICAHLNRQTEARTTPSKSAAACEPNRNAPENVHSRWQPNSTLRLMVTRGEFKAAEIQAFQDAIRLWKTVLPNSGTGIDLQYGGEITGADCSSCIVIRRKADLVGTFASLSMRSERGGFYSKAVINIKADIHKSPLLRLLLTHELGHAFGLDDCVECDGDTTVMNSVNRYAFGAFAFLAPRSKMAAAPTRCDVARVSEGYLAVTARAGLLFSQTQAPQATVAQTVPARKVQSVNARERSQSISTGSTALNGASVMQMSAPRHHATSSTGGWQRSIKVEQFQLMDALARHR